MKDSCPKLIYGIDNFSIDQWNWVISFYDLTIFFLYSLE